MRWIDFVCWFSRKFHDIHDYYRSWGGDDIPTHFYIYRCWNCGRGSLGSDGREECLD